MSSLFCYANNKVHILLSTEEWKEKKKIAESLTCILLAKQTYFC